MTNALADCAEELGQTYQRLADRLRRIARGREKSEQPPAPPGLGARQREVLALFRREGRPMTAREVSEGLKDYDLADVYFPLESLAGPRHRLLEVAEEDAPPKRWRLTARGAGREGE